jgi:caffeoyl-CoA O-methyltransferase
MKIGFVPRIIEQYAAAHTSALSQLLEELEAYTVSNCAFPQMLVGHFEGAFLAMLVRLSAARRILEVGLYTGYSALTMAEALPPDGELITCEIDAGTAAIAQLFFDRSEHGRKISIHLGPALETIAALPPAPLFDLVFLDADKENYVAYYHALLPRLRPGGLIVADNVLWSGGVLMPRNANQRALAEFNRTVRDDSGVECVMLPLRDGVTLVRKHP